MVGFCSMKRQEWLLLPLDGKLVHRRLPSSILLDLPSGAFVVFIRLGGQTHCEGKNRNQEHNTMSLAKARTLTDQSGL